MYLIDMYQLQDQTQNHDIIIIIHVCILQQALGKTEKKPYTKDVVV